jgi:Icc protein
MKRKTFLQTTAVLAGTSLISPFVKADPQRKKALRVAHITDTHLKPGEIPETGLKKALQHIHADKHEFDFIMNGGDSIMDALEADKEKTRIQWDLFKSVLAKENRLPIYHTIGNHDIWGWFIKENKPTTDRLYGKVWVVEELEMKHRYYSFVNRNWHFIVLDSTQLNPLGGYIAYLDDEQLFWLKEELANIPPSKNICFVSHIPILSICSGLFFEKTETNGDLRIQRNLMHTDFLTLRKLFEKYPNIRCCISGHIHLQDEVDYLGIKYYCNGAISGNWWKGSFQEFAPAYAIMEFNDDGTTKRTMVNYDTNEKAG